MEERKHRNKVRDQDDSSDDESYVIGGEEAIERAKRVIERVERDHDNRIELQNYGLHEIGFMVIG